MPQGGGKLAGKTAIVTGAGRNIGEEIAVLFAREGASVAVVDMDRDRAEKVAARIAGEGNSAIAVVCDVSDTGDIAKMVAATTQAFGAIDILVNNVAISDNKDIFDLTEDEWRQTIDVTLSSPFYVTKQVAKWMVDNERGGRIVNIGSTSGFKAGRAHWPIPPPRAGCSTSPSLSRCSLRPTASSSTRFRPT